MKVIQFNTPDGVYQLELKLVAENRADQYSEDVNSIDYQGEVNMIMNHDYEGVDWLINNTNYEDWEDVTKKINDEVNVTNDDFWSSSDDFKIIEVED